MYEDLPLIRLEDLDPEQIITNGRKSSYNPSLEQDNENLCFDGCQNDDESNASDGSYYDEDQKSLDIYENKEFPDDEDNEFENAPINCDERDLDLINDSYDDDEEESDDDDEYDNLIEEDD